MIMGRIVRMSMSFILILGGQHLGAQTYQIPPSRSTYSQVPYISDAAMEECVKLYNDAKWVGDEINRMDVNSYSQSSVNNYNKKVASHSQMTASFNNECAGKQSESAYKAARKLNSLN